MLLPVKMIVIRIGIDKEPFLWQAKLKSGINIDLEGAMNFK
jgi:hypothetical protein